MRKKIMVIIFLGMLCSLSFAWFWGPGNQIGLRVLITSANGFDTLAPDYNYDLGDTNAAITARAGGFNSAHAFEVGYPVQVLVKPEYDLTAEYTKIVLQYFQGTNSGTSSNWTTICTITNSLDEAEGKEGAHFGLITWYPPAVTNVPYLLRVYCEAVKSGTNYVQVNLAATNINCNGDGLPWGEGGTWFDWAVLGIKVIPRKNLQK